MSTYPQYTVKSHDVYTLTINTLDTVPLTMPGAIQSRELLRVLVLAAASRLSGHQACDPREVPLRDRPCWASCRARAATWMHAKAMSMLSWPHCFPRAWANAVAG